MSRNNVQLDGQYYPREDTGKGPHKFAVRESHKKGGEWVSTFFDCVAFDKQAEHIKQWHQKGSAICVDGYLSKSEWTNAEGQKRSKVEIVVTRPTFPPKDLASKEQTTEEPSQREAFDPFAD